MRMLQGKLGWSGFLCLMILLAPLAGCGGDQKPVAGKTGKIVVYSPVNDEYLRKIAAEFAKDSGIQVETVHLSAGEMIARVRAEKNSPQASVLYGGSADGYIQAKAEGLLEKYDSPHAAAIPAAMKDPGDYWTGIYIGYIGFVANKKILTELGVPLPLTWNDLLRPELKGRVLIANPGIAGAAYTMLATLVQLQGEPAAMQYMKKLHGQVKEYPKSAVTAVEKVGKGEAAVGVAFLQDAIRLREQGMQDIVISTPQEGTGYEIGAVGIVKNGPDQFAARKFVDWALSKKAQEIGQSVGSYQFPALPEAKSPPAVEPLRQSTRLIVYDFIWAGKNRKVLVEKWNALVK
jgi:iron(III) transport system substrate-binding protein